MATAKGVKQGGGRSCRQSRRWVCSVILLGAGTLQRGNRRNQLFPVCLEDGDFLKLGIPKWKTINIIYIHKYHQCDLPLVQYTLSHVVSKCLQHVGTETCRPATDSDPL